jgi:hypothetical protein
VIHVHSTYSDGQLPVARIARIADQQGLDFLILTDHNTLQAKREGKEGFHGKTLLLVGSEVSSEGHYLALRIREEIPEGQRFQPTLDAVAAQRGLGFFAPPLYRKKRWDHFGLRGFTGMEIYNAKEDVLEEGILQVAFWTFVTGLEFPLVRWIDRPDRNLELWELFRQLNAKLRGYYHYYGVVGNYRALEQFYRQALLILFKWLNRRSQRRSYNWLGFEELLEYHRVEKPRIVQWSTVRHVPSGTTA